MSGRNRQKSVQPLIYVPFFNRVSGAGGFMFRAWWGRMWLYCLSHALIAVWAPLQLAWDPISGHQRGSQIYRGQRESQDSNILKSCNMMVDVGPTKGTIGSLGGTEFWPFACMRKRNSKTAHWELNRLIGAIINIIKTMVWDYVQSRPRAPLFH